MNNIFYFPIMCCGQEMSDIMVNGERVQAVCQVCKKIWRPKPNPNISFTKGRIYVVHDEWPNEMNKYIDAWSTGTNEVLLKPKKE